LAAALINDGTPPRRLLDLGVDVEALSPTRLQP
jgi:hypothetical protein